MSEERGDLVFGESGFAHGDLLKGHIQYVGRSLKVNGPVKRDAYRRVTGGQNKSFTDQNRTTPHPPAVFGS